MKNPGRSSLRKVKPGGPNLAVVNAVFQATQNGDVKPLAELVLDGIPLSREARELAFNVMTGKWHPETRARKASATERGREIASYVMKIRVMYGLLQKEAISYAVDGFKVKRSTVYNALREHSAAIERTATYQATVQVARERRSY